MQKLIQSVTKIIMTQIFSADRGVCPMKVSLPEPKMLSEGYWRSILFSDSSVLETTKKIKIRCNVTIKLRQTTQRLKE